MRRIVALFNPYSGNNTGAESAKGLAEFYPDTTVEYKDICEITDYSEFCEGLDPEDTIVLCGGDGTLNRFANAIRNLNVTNPIYLYGVGTGNDFLRDLGIEKGTAPVLVSEYIKNLPTVTVKGKEYAFINGVGYGIDGYCCQVGDAMREQNKKNINYTAIAIKGLLFGYKPCGATVTVDGVTKRYEKAWIAPTMYGRFYGGGMLPAPEQRRNNEGNKVSFAIIHGSGKLKTLMVFPSIFEGKHVSHTEMVDVIRGDHVKVVFDNPAPLQIDGETILDVTEYEVHTHPAKADAENAKEQVSAQ